MFINIQNHLLNKIAFIFISSAAQESIQFLGVFTKSKELPNFLSNFIKFYVDFLQKLWTESGFHENWLSGSHL
jgi:hypothetical protein